MAVLYLDLDGFKEVNDTYGHETGDVLLASTADNLLRCVLGADTVGRLGGDEFAVILTRISGVDEAVTVAGRISTALTRPVEINGHRITPGASIGIALAEPGVAGDALLHQADTAMYHAKRDPTAHWRIYLDGLHDPDVPAATLGDEILGAIADDQLDVHYQPVVDLRTGELTGFEALVRLLLCAPARRTAGRRPARCRSGEPAAGASPGRPAADDERRLRGLGSGPPPRRRSAAPAGVTGRAAGGIRRSVRAGRRAARGRRRRSSCRGRRSRRWRRGR
jgi:diguanylate cyclase (GGDEF)-like protein